MIIFKKTKDLFNWLVKCRVAGRKICFIPTMGALHQGHLSLVKDAEKLKGISVCSIFVNPTQFNDPSDFQKYPIHLEQDIYLLEKNGLDALFIPPVEEMYPTGTGHLEHYSLGYLEEILEGKYRPGHFQGVCQVMHRLLSVVEPDHLFMGQKDYQQCMVIKRLLEIEHSNIIFHASPTLREKDGLAMSSRNSRLTPSERERAPAMYEALSDLKARIEPGNLTEILRKSREILFKNDFKIDYFQIATAAELHFIDDWDGMEKIIALAAAFQGDVRLIDNVLLNT
jgi:pantoate--beta-alanine ligase